MNDIVASADLIAEPGPAPDDAMVWIAGGTFRMGSDDHYPEEAPAHAVTVHGFWIDRYAVTNRDYPDGVVMPIGRGNRLVSAGCATGRSG